jgi:hypothetical protein
VRGVLRLPIAALLWLIAGTGLAISQAGTGGGSAGGGSVSPGAVAPGGAARTAPSAPGQPAPGVANTPVDPGRNNVDVNPPTRRLEGANPGTQRTPMAAPTGSNAQPGGQAGQPSAKAAGRPGAAQSANSDGYPECMAMWSPSNTGMSRQEWSKTCDKTRLPLRQ